MNWFDLVLSFQNIIKIIKWYQDTIFDSYKNGTLTKYQIASILTRTTATEIRYTFDTFNDLLKSSVTNVINEAVCTKRIETQNVYVLLLKYFMDIQQYFEGRTSFQDYARNMSTWRQPVSKI